jgi:hypothetical protein
LASRLSKSYVAGIVAGFLFTFSSYHFAHAVGHLQLVTMEWVPLFLLAWWELLHKPRYRYAIGAALALFLVILSDYYYFFYSFSAAVILLGYFLWKRDLAINKQNVKIFSVFAILTCVTSGVLVGSLLLLNHHDPLQGAHDATVFSMDAFAPFIPGGSWRWWSLTQNFWMRLPYLAESSIYFGSALLVLLVVALFARRRLKLPSWTLPWWIILFTFGILSLGPRLHLYGYTHNGVPLPYAFLEKILPTLKISGMPMRMIFMALLAAIILGSLVIAHINLRTLRGKIILGLIIIVSVIDLWPRPLPLTGTAYPPYVAYLKQLPKADIIDNGATNGSDSLYYQTIDNKPRAYGYVTRTTLSVDNKDFHVFADLAQGRYDNLCRVYHIRYLTTAQQYPTMNYPIVYSGINYRQMIYIYDLKNGPNC